MKILFVEDHLTFGPNMAENLRGIANVDSVDLCRSRALALEALSENFYDLLILDLTIPSNDGDFEIAPEHGQAVFYEAIKLCPGIPIFILTGSEMDEFIKGLVRHGEQVDIWGSRVKRNTLDYFEKENADRLMVEVEAVAREVAIVDSIALNTRGRQLDLKPGAERCIRVAARRLGAVAAEVVPLSNGLSRARVIRATMRNQAGHLILATAAKLGTQAEIEVEIAAFDRDAKRLPIGFFPPLADTVDKGACGAAGAFYTLAEGYSSSLFDLLAADEAAAVAVVGTIRDRLRIWIDASTMRQGTIGDVRRRILWDESFTEIATRYDLDLLDIEGRTLNYRECCLHGDLHGANILVDATRQPILIDFGDVGPGPACFDPVMLDLSTAFHPDGVRLGLSERVLPALEYWPDPDKCIEQHPFRDFARTCRDWGYDVAGHDMAVLATAYAYLVRQLRFDTVAPETTLKILASVTDRIRRG